MTIKKSLYVVSLLVAFFSAALIAEPSSAGKDSIGPVSASTLLSIDAFSSQYESTSVSTGEVELLAAIDASISLQLLFGTWCHDSVREVPRLIKLLESTANPNIVLQLTAISRDKLEPARFVAQYNVKFTPTLVVLRDGAEVGRIIETPHQNWAVAIAALVGQY